jgi:nucleoside 2-deoxyribosyltransferase
MVKKRLYLAGPLFSQAEREYNRILKKSLSPYFDVFLPQENGGLFVNLVAGGMAINHAAKRIFNCDIEAIEASDVLLIVLDGRAIDEGAAFELGVAFARGKKCVALQTDIRRLLPIGNNPMIDCAVESVFENIESLGMWARAFVNKPSIKTTNQ